MNKNLIDKLRKAADALEDLNNMLEKGPTYKGEPDFPKQIEWKPANEEQEEKRLIRLSGTPLVSNPLKDLYTADYDKLMQPKTLHDLIPVKIKVKDKTHWTQKPQNRKRMLANTKKMLKALKAKQKKG